MSGKVNEEVKLGGRNLLLEVLQSLLQIERLKDTNYARYHDPCIVHELFIKQLNYVITYWFTYSVFIYVHI